MVFEGQNYKIINGFLLIWCLFIHTLPAFCQTEPPISSDHFSKSKGLSHRNIIDLMEGPSGRLWISTIQGLNYYNGHEIKEVFLLNSDSSLSQPLRARFVKDMHGNLIAIPSMGDEQIPFLVEDSSGYTPPYFSSGLTYELPVPSETCRYNLIGFEKSVQGQKAFGLFSDYLGLREDETDSLELWELINQICYLGPRDKFRGLDIITSFKNGSFAIWIPNSSFILIKPDFQHFDIIPYPDRGDIPNNWNSDLPLDKNGQFWFPIEVANEELIFHRFEVPEYFLENSQGVIIDRKNDLWFYTQEGPLLKYQHSSGTTLQFDDVKDLVFFIYPGSDDVLWIGTFNGLYRFTFSGNKFLRIGDLPFKPENPAPVGTSVREIAENWDGKIFALENYGPLLKIDRSSNQLIPVLENFPESNQPINLTSLLIPSKSYGGMDFVLGSRLGLLLWNSQKGDFYQPKYEPANKAIIHLYQTDKAEEVLGINDENEFFTINLQTLNISEEGTISDLDFKPIALKDNHIYGNFEGGLARFNLKTYQIDQLFQLEKNQDVIGEDIRSIIFSDTIIWLGTFEGLYGLDSENFDLKFYFNKKNGLRGEIIYAMVADEEGLWLGTDNGLSFINPFTGFTSSFFEWDGLSHNEFNTRSTLTDKDGLIWMGGLNGINVFDPSDLKNRQLEPKSLYLNSVSIFKNTNDLVQHHHISSSDVIGKIVLEPGANSFFAEVEHNITSLSNASVYSWYLEGLEPTWHNQSGVPQINYSYLLPGNYTLRIKAKDFRGLPASNELRIPIQIMEFWYFRTWAKMLWISLFGLSVFFIARYIFNRKLDRLQVLQLEELDRQKSHLYTNITHEFRTPLTVILGLSDLPEKSSFSKGELLVKFNKIKKGGKQLLDLVNQLLDLARLESGEVVLDAQPVKIEEFLKHLVFSFDSVAEAKGIKLLFQFEGDKEELFIISPRQFQQVVSNLLSNALKFTPKGGVVKVKAFILQSPRPDHFTLMCEVIDSGPGIPPQKAEVIFDRFHRLNTELTNDTPGSGIGLSLAKELVELMGGTIGVKTSKVGAAFFFKLSLKKSDYSKESTFNVEKFTRSVSIPESEFSSGTEATDKTDSGVLALDEGKPQILIVEDHPDVLHYIRSCIPKKYKTHIARDGEQGYEKALKLVPDLIVSDVMMPGMDGYSLCDQLKNKRATSHIPILLLTARIDEDSRLEGFKKGADAYLSKPFIKEELLLRIDNMTRLTHNLKSKFQNFNPENLEPNSLLSEEDQFMADFYKVVESRYSNAELTVEEIAEMLHLSRSQFYRKIKALTGNTPTLLLRDFRLDKSQKVFEQNSGKNISEVAYLVGFSNPKYFSKVYFEKFQTRPGKTAIKE